MRCREMQVEESSPAETQMLVPQGDGDGGEVEAGGAEAMTESRGEAGGAEATTESQVEAEGREREREGNDAPCLEAR